MADGLNDDLEPMEGMAAVELPSGAEFMVHEQELSYFRQRVAKYLSDNDFINVSDFQDVDRLLTLELLAHRYGFWLSTQRDYWGDPVDENSLQKHLKESSAEIRMLKKEMGLDRATREKLRGEDSVENYNANLRERALHFGYMRDEQFAMSIELFMELQAKITLHDNCTEKERIERSITTEDLMNWLRETAIPKFNNIDLEFRKEQRMWIRKM